MQIVQALLTVAGGALGVWGFTELAKNIPEIPLFKGDTTKIRSFTAVLSALLTAFVAWQQGSLSGPDLQSVAVTVLTFLLTWGGSHVVHKNVKPSGPVE